MPSPPAFLPATGREPESILILKPSSLGDVIHTLPAVAALRRHWPGAKLRWLVNPEWAPLLENNPAVDEVALFPRPSFRGPLAPLRLLSWARRFGLVSKADLVLDFQGLLRSALVGHFCKRSAFFGLSDAREGARFFYHAAASVSPAQHAVDRYLALVRALGVPVSEPLQWPLPSGDAPAGFDTHTPFYALHPFSRGQGKSLSLGDVQTLCEALAPARVVLLGRSESSPPPLPNVDNWLNRTSLLELAAILRLTRWTISVDSGPMHLAAALSPRVLALHTWSDPQKVGPYPKEAWVWKAGHLFPRGRPEALTPAARFADIAAWVAQQKP
ncbi:MAG: heptosyltransferase-1/heptosyltransferase-2 [Verrucomicrobia bacterium]|nr:MAG: heptosyltransferase-1/heptosyltransferase-2 [Verrucomicrobiota bacterium]